MIEELGKEKALEIIEKAYQKYTNEHFVIIAGPWKNKILRLSDGWYWNR